MHRPLADTRYDAFHEPARAPPVAPAPAPQLIDMEADLDVALLRHCTYNVRLFCLAIFRVVSPRFSRFPCHFACFQVDKRMFESVAGLGQSLLSPASAATKKSKLPIVVKGKCGMAAVRHGAVCVVADGKHKDPFNVNWRCFTCSPKDLEQADTSSGLEDRNRRVFGLLLTS